MKLRFDISQREKSLFKSATHMVCTLEMQEESYTYQKVLVSTQQVKALHLPQSSLYVIFGILGTLVTSEYYYTQPQTWCTPRKDTREVIQENGR